MAGMPFASSAMLAYMPTSPLVGAEPTGVEPSMVMGAVHCAEGPP